MNCPYGGRTIVNHPYVGRSFMYDEDAVKMIGNDNGGINGDAGEAGG